MSDKIIPHSCLGPQNGEPACPCATAKLEGRIPYTKQQRQIATAEDCQKPWAGRPDGERFRCYLCGHKFQPGDGWRWVNAQALTVIRVEDGQTLRVGDLVTCDACDGPDVLERWQQRHESYYGTWDFWALRQI